MAVDYLGFEYFRCHNRTLNFIVTNNIVFFSFNERENRWILFILLC